ncbi:MAG: hypothetical protein ACYDD1_01790 [Caulobacteraceae bacterium]
MKTALFATASLFAAGLLAVAAFATSPRVDHERGYGGVSVSLMR